MNIIEDKIQALQDFQDNVYSLIIDIVIKNDNIVIEYNTEDQLYEKGILSTGISIDSFAPYSPVTIQMKQIKGQPYDRVTLRDENKFHSSFQVIRISDGVAEIIALDDKTDELLRQYGKDVLGLTEDNLDDLTWSYVYEDLLTKMSEI